MAFGSIWLVIWIKYMKDFFTVFTQTEKQHRAFHNLSDAWHLNYGPFGNNHKKYQVQSID